jgi:hypothetical protein
MFRVGLGLLPSSVAFVRQLSHSDLRKNVQ